MDFNDTADEAAFRTRGARLARGQRDAAAPGEKPSRARGADAIAIAEAKAWQAKKAAAGFACITWPKAVGGRGGTPIQQIIYAQEEANYATPPDVFAIGLGMCVPTVMKHGTRGARAALRQPGHARRGDLVPAVLRAGRRLRRRRHPHARRARRRATGSSTARRSGPQARTSATSACC